MCVSPASIYILILCLQKADINILPWQATKRWTKSEISMKLLLVAVQCSQTVTDISILAMSDHYAMTHTLLPFSVFSSIRNFTFIRIFNPCILTIFKHLILYLHSTVITHCYNFLRIFLMTNHWNDLSPPPPPPKKSSVDRIRFNMVYKHVYLFRIFLTVHVKNRNFSPISTRLCLSVCLSVQI